MSVSSSANSSAGRYPRNNVIRSIERQRRSHGKARFSLLGLTQLGDEAGLRADVWWKDRASEPL